MGTYREGTSYKLTTVDDFLYVFPSAMEPQILGKDDYYFTRVSISQKDSGYDVWEDKAAAPETAAGVDQSVAIYAMYADSTDWELVTTLDWKDSGIMEYNFTSEQLAREPWRVKAEHETINYSTTCDIEVNVCLRWDSPVMAEIMEKYEAGDLTSMRLENISGVIGGQYKTEDGEQILVDYLHGQGTGDDSYNYDEPGLEEATKELYKHENTGEGILLQRDNAYMDLKGLTKSAASYKTAKSTNDPDNSRVLIDYCLTAYDGYEIYGEAGVNLLKEAGAASPGRNHVVFYDLLPYGVRFDASQEVTAGRITNIKDNQYQSQPKSWSRNQVTVTVDSQKDVIENYQGTGRTMVVFHIEYDGADSAVYSNQMWLEGWGVSFRAYYDWKDVDIVQEGTNISAFMPEDLEGEPLYQKPLCGTDTEVACDDGIIVPEDLTGDYAPFKGGDINGDKITDIRNVLYAKTAAVEDITIASTSGITKLVRADSDRFGVYGTSAVAEPGGGYTYDITVSNATDELEDIVVFDRLENAAKDRGDSNDPMDFEDSSWYGTFQSVVTTGAEELGIAPVIWYNMQRDAVLPGENESPADVLISDNGWYTAAQWEEEGYSLSDVKAVAVDLSTKSDGTDFILGEMKSVTFQIKMQAPEEMPTALYAYNNPSFYSQQIGTGTAQTVEGDSVRVRLGEREQLEIIKELRGEVPESMKNAAFEFCLSQMDGQEELPFANKEYELWQKNEDGIWEQQTGRLYATDGEGYLTLQAGEKAVFPELPDVSRIHVQESESPYWETDVEDTGTEEGKRTVTVNNRYRSVLYVQKKLEAVPGDVDVSDTEFTFRIRVKDKDGEYTPLKEAEFWYVDSVRVDGGSPGKLGKGKTDENGEFSIKQGEIIALFLGDAGASYELMETKGAGDGTDWICRSDTVTGTVPALGASVAISNIYKWKDLYLTKNLTHQDAEDCSQKFTFKICETDEEGNEIPVTEKEWVLLNKDRTETGTKGTLDENGEFTCACAGMVVKIQGLEAGKTYLIKETESGEFYRPAADQIEVEIPLYSTSQNAEITNDYLKRPLSVTKIVTYDPDSPDQIEEVKDKTFTMTVEIDGEPLADYPYVLMESGSVAAEGLKTDNAGKFELKNGQTATFEDVGVQGAAFKVTETQDDDYPQIFPARQEPHEGELGAEGSAVTFVNGTPGNLILSKVYEGADEIANQYIEMMKVDKIFPMYGFITETQVNLTLTVTDEDGSSYIWPKSSQSVTVIDQIYGRSDVKSWESGSSFALQSWESVVIPALALEGVVSYEVTESAEDQHRIFDWMFKDYTMENPTVRRNWLEASQKDPAGDRGVSGTLEEKPVAEITNLLTTVHLEGSEIEKRMTLESEAVPVGAELVWRVERYDGTTWNPAEGVPYLTFDEAGRTCDRILETGKDGKILLTKTENGYPRVKFDQDTVYLNYYEDAKEGDLRIIELLEESDEMWGVLAGYGDADNYKEYSPGLPKEEAGAFVNTNTGSPAEIEKIMENPTDDTFTMILEQVLSASAPLITDSDQIIESRPGADITYTVYDTESGEEAGTQTTGKNGEIYLQAGQYARLDLPSRSLWTVREEQRADYVLKEVRGTPDDKISKLGDNLMLINQSLKEEWNVAGEIEITRAMVERGYVFDAETGERAVLNAGKVRIPEYIIEKGKIYEVVGIGNNAFNDDWNSSGWHYWNITGIEFPDSLKYIEEEAFYSCSSLTGTLIIPENVERIGEGAFYDCASLTGLSLPKGLTKIESDTFMNCRSLTELSLPEGLTRIESNAFYRCSGLTGELRLPENLTYIGLRAFQDCSGLTGELKIPESVTQIGQNAFNGTSFTSITIDKKKNSISGSPWGWSGGKDAVIWLK